MGVYPDAGGGAGADMVEVRGKHFTNRTAILFGAARSPLISVLSSSLMRAVSPPGVPGVARIRCSTNGVDFSETGPSYTYFAAASISGIQVRERESFIVNLLVRIHFIIVMIWWTVHLWHPGHNL